MEISPVCSPGDAPVGLDLQDGGIVRVVELDLRVPELGCVDVHHDGRGAGSLSRRGHAHNLFAVAPAGRGDKWTLRHGGSNRSVCAEETLHVHVLSND